MQVFSKDAVRKFLVQYQGLDRKADIAGIPGFVAKVGCIQFDPLNIVGRNPDLVLQSRFGNYRPDILGRFLYQERVLIDAWDKMMAIIHRDDWPCLEGVRDFKKDEIIHVLGNRNSLAALDKLDEALAHLASTGPCKASILDLGRVDPGRWGNSNLANAAMDYLFCTGKVGVWNKINTQKVYALIQDILPAELLAAGPIFADQREYHRWYIVRRIASIGVLWNRNSVLWIGFDHQLRDRVYRADLLAGLVEDGSVAPIRVDGLDEIFYVKASELPALEAAARSGGTVDAGPVRFLAPLDNLIWDRDLVSAIFDFDYTWEVYIPPPKRKYGYYVLPLLFGNRFAGRFEPVVDKKQKKLVIKAVWMEEGFEVTAGFRQAFGAELEDFARFLGVSVPGDLPV